jgi:hypothetical protein
MKHKKRRRQEAGTETARKRATDVMNNVPISPPSGRHDRQQAVDASKAGIGKLASGVAIRASHRTIDEPDWLLPRALR